jgi:hypothetical protein
MKTFTQFLREQTNNKTAVIAYGRYNPPTIGHQKLFNKVVEISKKKQADGFIVPTHTVDHKKNPLTFEEKKRLIELMIMTSDLEILDCGKTLIDLLQNLQARGYTRIIHVAGQPDIPGFKKVVDMYNNKPDKNNIIPFSFEEYEFESAGERDPAPKKVSAGEKIPASKDESAGERDPVSTSSPSTTQDVSGVSGTKLRQFAVDGNLKEFKRGMSSTISDDLKVGTYDKIRERIKK